MILTHRDNVADHAKWKNRFPDLQRIIHRCILLYIPTIHWCCCLYAHISYIQYIYRPIVRYAHEKAIMLHLSYRLVGMSHLLVNVCFDVIHTYLFRNGRLDVTPDTADCEVKLDGFSTWRPAVDMTIIHTPVSATFGMMQPSPIICICFGACVAQLPLYLYLFDDNANT